MKQAFDHIPFAPRRYPFFYGWLVVVLGSVGFIMSSPGQTYGVSPFTDALIDALGLTRVQLSLAYMCGTIGSALCLTFAGRAYDRFGARVVAPAASLTLGMVLVLLSQCDHIAAGLSAALGLADSQTTGFVIVLLLFFGLRFSGQGVLTMASNNMRMKWFDRHRGLMAGVCGMVIAPVFSATPAVLNALVESTGWRGAWIRLAILVGGVFTVIAMLFFRDNPEDCGLVPDGPLADKSLGSKPHPKVERHQFTLAEACGSYSFWIFAVGVALFSFYITGMSFHAASIFEHAGLERSRGYMIFFYAAVVSVILRPFVGWLCDRVPLKYLLMTLLGGIATSSTGLRLLDDGIPMWTVIIGNAFSVASIGSLASVTWPHFYGRRHLGAISGFNMSLTVAASAIAPWLFSRCLASYGSYAPVIGVTTAMAALWFCLALGANNPQRHLGIP